MKYLVSQFVGSRGTLSWLIKLKGGGPFSHVDLVLPDGGLLGAQGSALGGKPAGVYIRPPAYEKWDAIARVGVPVTDAQYEKAIDFAKSQIGKPYDWTSIVAFAAERDWRNAKAWFCSELNIRTHEVAGVFNFPLEAAANKIDPCSGFAILSTWGKVSKMKGF